MSPSPNDLSKLESLEIRLLAERDIPAAMRLKELAHWNQTTEDWRRLLRLEPRGCFAACFQSRLVATTTFTTYGPDLAWIGMVLVDPEFRRRGIATALLRTALESLQRDGVQTVKLDATPAGQPVYEALGFARESLIQRWEGTASKSAAATECSTLSAQVWPELLELDRRAFGADRPSLLAFLETDSDAPPLIVRAAGGQLSGYALSRRGTNASYIGPLVAADEQTAIKLLDGMLDGLAGKRVYIDLNTDYEDGSEALARRGFIKQRDLIRMRRGQKSSAGISQLVLAIAGPEVG